MLFYFLHWVNLNLSDMRNWVNKTLSNWMQLNLSLTKFQVSTSAINSFNSMNFSVFHVSGKCNLVLFPVSLSHQADRWWKTIIFFTVTSLMVDAVGHVYKQKHNALLVQNWWIWQIVLKAESEKYFSIESRTFSSSLLLAIIARNHPSFFKIFSHFLHFCPNVQIFCPFLPIFNIVFALFCFFSEKSQHAHTF